MANKTEAKEVLKQEKKILMDQVKSDFKFLSGYDLTFVKEANGLYNIVVSKDGKNLRLEVGLESPVMDLLVISAVADQVTKLSKQEISNLELK